MKETSLALALSMLSFMLAVIWGGPLIRILRYFKIGKLIRVEGPDTHIVKMARPLWRRDVILRLPCSPFC